MKKLDFLLEYFTKYGESLLLTLQDGTTLPMTCAGSSQWRASLEIPSNQCTSDGKIELEYSFSLVSNGVTVRNEWRGHAISVPANCEYVEVRDSWHDRPEDLPFRSKAFTDVIFAHPAPKTSTKTATTSRTKSKVAGLIFNVPASMVQKDQVLGICGSGQLFDNWQKVLPLDLTHAPYWSIFLEATEGFEYKFVILDAKSKVILSWEVGPNHAVYDLPSPGNALVISNLTPHFNLQPWHGTGVAMPVFSLRTEDSFGVGEFADIKRLADWAAAAGMSVIQILPINDTTMTGTWKDSYPYNANSSFALHPQFLNLPAAGLPVDKRYLTARKKLEALPNEDYEKVMAEKNKFLHELFADTSAKVFRSVLYKRFFEANKDWLVPYSVFSVLRDLNGTAIFSNWKELAKFDSKAVDKFFKTHKEETSFYCFVQYHLDVQLKDAVEYAHSKGVALKGDLPIGVSRTSVDAWQHPELFNLDSQAGAPPDAFSQDGQNWGFPTYNWETMALDGYAWWKARLRKMSEYFDLFRIDHILGFFRIWEIPLGVKSGLLGHFNPAMPYSADELSSRGFGAYLHNSELDVNSLIFLPDPHKPGFFHPAIGAKSTSTYNNLDGYMRSSFDNLYYDFFYHRHNSFWKELAMKKLPALLDSTNMLACGEDLGMIPDCVPEVMSDLHILSLEIQRMPKAVGKLFDNPAWYPYYSVCATGTHDTSNLRAWWKEDASQTEQYFDEFIRPAMPGFEGPAPAECTPEICSRIVDQHVHSSSMLCILPIQDWLSTDPKLCSKCAPEEERINLPSNPDNYWRWRLHLPIEKLSK